MDSLLPLPHTERARERVVEPRLSPGIVARLGFELELGGVRVHPFVPKGSHLIKGRGWHLETDRLPNCEESDLEFIVHPTASRAEIETSIDDIVELVAQMRTLAMRGSRRRLHIASLADPQRRWQLVPDASPLELELRDMHCVARLQPTCGVSLLDMAVKLDSVCTPESAYKIFLSAERVERRFRETQGTSLSPACKGFVQLIVYYLNSAGSVTPRADESTVHVFFRMLARSDFCAIHDKLLDDDERQQMRVLLQPMRPRTLPLLMEALVIDGSCPVFKAGYMNERYGRESGPRVRQWLESIVRGRDDGAYKKDLLSPPFGYRLHSGDLARDYGMGAMGVDEVNKLVLFEIRYSPRLQHDIPMNRHARHAVLVAYAAAQPFNPVLEKPVRIPEDESRRYGLLYRYEAVYGALKKVRKRLRQQSNPAEAQGQMLPLPPAVLAARVKVARLQREVDMLGRPDGLAATNASLSRVEQWLDAQVGLGDTRIAAAGREFNTLLDEFEQALWDAGRQCPVELQRARGD
jgi:hypothetical protein